MWIETIKDDMIANTDYFEKMTIYYKDFIDKETKEKRSYYILAGMPSGIYVEINKFNTEKEAKQAMLDLMRALNEEKVHRSIKYEPYIPINPCPAYPQPYTTPNEPTITPFPYISPYTHWYSPTVTTPKIECQPTWATTNTDSNTAKEGCTKCNNSVKGITNER